MLIECGNCGAPLDVEGDETVVHCKYCQRSNKVKSTRTLAAVTPADWAPPTDWQPRPGVEIHVGEVAPQAMAVAAGGIGLATVLPGCIGLGVLLIAGGAIVTALLFAGPGLGPSWDGSAPFECGGNEEVRISNVIADLPGETAVTVRSNCELTIENATITAARGIEVQGNGQVQLRNTVIRATETGAVVSLNGDLEITNTQLISEGVGVDARNNADIRGSSSRIEGRPALNVTRNVDVASTIEIVDR